MHSAKTYFAVCFCLPSVFYLALGKHGLCRVSDKIHSAKTPALGKSSVSRSGKRIHYLPSGNLYGFNGNRDGYVNFFVNVTWICNTGVSYFSNGFQLLQVNNT